jgi:hypothetical protein
MICLNPIIHSPLMAGLFASACAMLYLFLMTISSGLPQIVFISLAVGLVVYYMRGGRLLCDESPKQGIPIHASSETVEPNMEQLPIGSKLATCGIPGLPACAPTRAYKL